MSILTGNSTLSDILLRLPWGESDDLELKSARGGLPQSLWETYGGMANTRGGIILLGIENDGSISGLKDLSKIKKNFWDTINNRGKVSVNLLTSADVQEITHSQGTILAIRIPRASRNHRPVFIGQNPLTGTFKRNSEGDYRCTDQEVRRMLADGSEEPQDSQILDSFTMKDLDLQSLQQYRQRFASHNPAHPWLSEHDQGLLQKLGGWGFCRNIQKEGITRAGLLMFGREESLREALPQYHVDYREKLSDNPEVRWTDRLTLDGTWSGNLFQFYMRTIQKLSADLKLPFQLGDELFRKGETPVHVSIREALVNALIHADYNGQGGIVIEKYQNRFEFSNPGSLLISLDQLQKGGISVCRNKSLQQMFMMIGAAEKAGSGIDKIRAGWKSQHWRSPKIQEQVQPDRVIWTLSMMSLIPDDSLFRLKNKFKKEFSKFTPLEIQALVSADLEGTVDNARMREITQGHGADITKLLQELVSKGALHQKGQRRWTTYSLSDSLHNTFDPSHNTFDPSHNTFDPRGKTKISENQWDEIFKLAHPARQNKKLSAEKMEQLILKITENHWFSRRDLSNLLQRNPVSLVSRFLTPMVRRGVLRLRYPDKPKRVDQAYTSAKE